MRNSSLNITHSARSLGFVFDEHFAFSDQIPALYESHICDFRCIRSTLASK